MLEKSHLKFIYSSPLYFIAEKQGTAQVKELEPEVKKQPEITVTEEPEIKKQPEVALTKEPEPEVIRKHALVLYSGKDLNPDESGLLIKILQSVNVKLEDAALVNTNNLKQGFLYTDFIKQYDYSKLISFGAETYKVGFPLSKNTIRAEDGRKYLFTDSLGELNKDVAKKKALWNLLKELFAI